MTEQPHTQQQAIQYLLGSLPEAEMERLDALSFTDADFAEKLSAAEKELVDSYVQGELTGDILERFESHYLASPLRRNKVEFAETFQIYAKRNMPNASARSVAEKLNPKRTAAVFFSALNIFRNQSPALQWSFATAVCALLALGVWWTFNNRSVQNNHTVASFILTPEMRGTGQIRTLSIPARTGYVAMKLELEPTDYPAYQVVLLDEPDNRTLWRSDNLRKTVTDSSEALSIRFPAGLLQSRNYLLRVTGLPATGGAEIVGDYLIQVVK